MPNPTLQEAKELLLDCAAMLTRTSQHLKVLQSQLGLGEGQRDMAGSMADELALDTRLLMAMWRKIELDPTVKSAAAE